MSDVPEYELEHHFKVQNNQNGECVSVGPDSEGLDLIEINYNGVSKVFLNYEQAAMVAEALNMLLRGRE